jgi:hypothetical protein
MRWKLILPLSSIGLLAGTLTVLGYTSGIGVWLWLGEAVALAFIIGKYVPSRYFAHGFATAAFWSLIVSVIRLVFFRAWLANNPSVGSDAATITRTWPAVNLWWASVLITPVAAAVNGVVLGLLSLIAGKLIGKRAFRDLAEKTVGDRP